jgi:4-diphosphocytidyl-2-C-methyl-D-erythritol kinase
MDISLRVLAPCKINIGLEIWGIDSQTNFHFIKTVMIPVGIYDELSFETIESGFKIISDSDIPLDKNNICYKAFKEFRKRYQTKGLRVEIKKNIPVGSGLGGGSSDAAETIRYLASVSNDKPTTQGLLKIAERVGYDVPFFIISKPAIASGFGEKIETIDIPLDFWVIISWRGEGVLTEWAYNEYDKYINNSDNPIKMDWDEILDLLFRGELVKLKGASTNIFEEVLFEKRGDLKKLKDIFNKEGVLYTSLSGSGSAVYGLVREYERAVEIKERMMKEEISAMVAKPLKKGYQLNSINRNS